MNNQEYILKSEVRKMIEKKIEEKDSFYVNHEYTDGLEELLSELDNLSGVSGWIPVTERLPNNIPYRLPVILYRESWRGGMRVGFYFDTFNTFNSYDSGELSPQPTHWMPLPPHP